MTSEIVFDDKLIKKVNNKEGVYNQLKEVRVIKSKPFIDNLKSELMSTIEVAFREYARSHKNCSKALEEKEWKYFKTKLLKYL